MLVTVGAGLAVAVAFAFWHRPQPVPPGIGVTPELPEITRPAAAPPALLTVHVSGAVLRPGLVILGEGSRVADAVAAVGGGMPGSDLGRLNLAALIADGMHIVVPWVDGGSQGSAPIEDEGSSSFPVNLNQAGVERLSELPGVGEVLAARIVAHREARGPFAVVEDLLDVPGIGEGKLAGLRDYAVVRR